jgi:nucleoid-associated protein YgaU
MGRYSKTEIKTKGFQKYYSTTIVSKPPESDEDVFIVTTDGDRLDNLAFQFYGNPQLWYFIANANGLFSMTVDAGTSLRIPGAPSSLGI